MRKFLSIVLIALSVKSIQAQAGSTQSGEPKFQPNEIAQFAKQVERYSAAKRAHVFVIARVGQPQKTLPKGVEFTHVALAVYSQITIENGEQKQGYAIHNLYQLHDDPAKSSLVIDYPTDFFWAVDELKAGIAIPTLAVQKQLLDAINKDVPSKVHNPRYSLIANPFNNKRQNCTEHTLNVINAAIYNTTDMAQLKANTKAYFDPQPLSISPFKLLLGSVFRDEIYKKDHKGKVKIATFTTIKDYLAKHNLLEHSAVITPKMLSNIQNSKEI
ncbi:DUF2145 domain-containing protein [Pseudoalteromonas luteoviolacea]|uniref:DUF2145 domain-containing protein n=1 Tax=Pseudoalteromonas luteoviolacea TaxID=43657 RepID=UPI00114F6C03|nr:DUF2145 domain-containing protein [Pseudoalteromonas luteoviolacea]TQF67752.1 DUF2145 domain-containing protein [Pseudoalteromonas luteoviolacea]